MAEAAAPQMALTDDGRVHMFDSAGSPVTVDRAEVDNALAAGFALEAAESVQARRIERERSTLGQQALTVAEGALEGATVGLGTYAATELLGDDYREAARERAMVNPGLRTVGQVVGTVAPVALSGGSSLAARGVTTLGAPARGVAALGNLAERGAARLVRGIGVTGESILGRAALRGAELGAAGAVEGAAYGLGSSLADSALEDTEWTADKALAAMADGGWYGLASGGGLGVGGSVVSSAGKAALAKMLGGKSFQAAVKDLAETRAVKQTIGHNAKLYNDITNSGANPERLNRIGRKLLDRDIPLTGTLDDAARAVESQTDDAVQRLKNVAAKADEAGLKVDSSEVLGRIDDQLEKLKQVDLTSYKQVARKLEREVEPFRKKVSAGRRFEVGPDGKAVAVPNYKDLTFTDMWELRKKLDDTVKWSSRAANPATDALKSLRREFDDSLTRTLEGKANTAGELLAKNAETPQNAQAIGSLRDEWKAAKEDYADFRVVADGIEDELVRREKNRFISPSDYGAGGVAGGTLALLTGMATGSTVLGALTGYGTGLVNSAAHKLIRERGSGVIAKLADRISKNELRNTRAARVLAGLEKPTRLVTRAVVQHQSAQQRSERFKGALEHVQRFTQDPDYADAQLRHMFGEIASEQPEVAQRMMLAVNADMAYLKSIAPKGLSNGAKSWTPLKEKQTYTKDQQKRFLSAVTALAEPAAVADKLAEGDIDLDAIDALKARRPREYADLREKVMLACGEREDELPYKRVNFLSLAFDFAGDSSHDPATIAAIQASVLPANHPGPNKTSFGPETTESMTLPNEAALGA